MFFNINSKFSSNFLSVVFVLISTNSLSLKFPIGDLKTQTSGISWNGLSIIFNRDMIVWISLEFRYYEDVSEKTGIFASNILFSYIGAMSFVERSNITISLYFKSLYSPFFKSYTL